MRRQIVIMLLGLMTTLSLPAFAIAGSRENDHATQPYKYIGKEHDRAHSLDWYDHGARHYDPATGRWNTMDPMCEKYYGISPYYADIDINYFTKDDLFSFPEVRKYGLPKDYHMPSFDIKRITMYSKILVLIVD